MRTITNIMLVNLAVADILSLIWSLPKRYFDLIDSHSSGEAGVWLCRLFTANNMAAITLAVSVYTMILLAGSVTTPSRHRLNRRGHTKTTWHTPWTGRGL